MSAAISPRAWSASFRRPLLLGYFGETLKPDAAIATTACCRLPCALQAWRAQVARSRGVPAYVVLHDSTIDGIAASRPTTLTQLREIPGFGDKKLEHYELIALVKAGRTGA